MREYQSTEPHEMGLRESIRALSHTRWDCKYHVVFIPKRRKKSIFGALRKHLGTQPPSGGSRGESAFEALTQ